MCQNLCNLIGFPLIFFSTQKYNNCKFKSYTYVFFYQLRYFRSLVRLRPVCSTQVQQSNLLKRYQIRQLYNNNIIQCLKQTMRQGSDKTLQINGSKQCAMKFEQYNRIIFCYISSPVSRLQIYNNSTAVLSIQSRHRQSKYRLRQGDMGV